MGERVRRFSGFLDDAAVTGHSAPVAASDRPLRVETELDTEAMNQILNVWERRSVV